MITNDEILSWISSQHGWLSDAVKTYFNNGKFSDSDIKRFADICIDEATGKKTKTDINGINLLSHDVANGFEILAISNVQGVNALKPGQELDFKDHGVTVVYGDNGSGKSGYIRIFKQLANARYKDDILGNVYKKHNNVQACDIKIKTDDVEKEFHCDLKQPGQFRELTNIDIFDSKISEAYVENANEASYEPWIFELFSSLANVTDKIKAELESRKVNYQIVNIDIPEKLYNSNPIKSLFPLSGTTSIDTEKYIWEKIDEDQLAELHRHDNTEAVMLEIQKNESSIKNINSLAKELEKFKEYYSRQHTDEIKKLKNAWINSTEKKNAAKLLFEKDADEIDKISISNHAWIALWKSASDYYNDVLSKQGDLKYTEVNGRCPLCRQIIKDDNVRARLISIDDYVNGIASKEENENKSKYVYEVRSLKNCWDEEQLKNILSSCNIDSINDEILKIFSQIKADYSLIEIRDFEKLEINSIDIEKYINKLNDIAQQRSNSVNIDKSLLQEEKHKELQTRINDLEGKYFISQHITTILDNIENYKKLSIIDKAESLVSSAGITRKSRELAKELLSDEYIERFNNELNKLTKKTISVKLVQQKAGKGKIPFRVQLNGVSENGNKITPEEVLSEGERRVVSLAAFFAEAAGREECTPLIVDDPISSLDYTYESAVIKRLAEAAKHRQVIVFTHRISMAVGLKEASDKIGISYEERTISGRGPEKGIPVAANEYNMKPKKAINKLINENIQRVKSKDINDPGYDEAIHHICQQMRIIVEKSVEDILLNGVVVRFRKDVQTNNRIAKLADISRDDCNMIDHYMTKYSYYDHSMADETPFIEYSIDEIEQDANKLRDWIITKEKMNNI